VKKYIALLLVFSSSMVWADLTPIVPQPLKKGDLIAIVFPASFLDKSAEEGQLILNRKLAWLRSKGYRTIVYPSRVQIKGYLAGTDTQRAHNLMMAWKNNQVKAIWCLRGGYGTPRMLDLLDYTWIRNHPKILIGMSDITALHQAIQKRTGLVTYLAPVFNYFDEADSDFDATYAFSSLEQVLVKQKTGIIELPEIAEKSASSGQMLSSGKGRGRLVGGNLSLIACMCGTKWQLDTKGKILLLEDVGEEIFRIDRMLWQIREAGLLDKPAAVILGSWKDCKASQRNSLSLDEVLDHYFAGKSYPVIKGFPTGHGNFQTTLPLNGLAEVDTETMTVKLVNAPEKVPEAVEQ